jgi:hypothetical protein
LARWAVSLPGASKKSVQSVRARNRSKAEQVRKDRQRLGRQEHGMRSRQLVWVDHQLAVDRVERLDDLSVGESLLSLFAEGFAPPTIGRQYIGYVDHDFAV